MKNYGLHRLYVVAFLVFAVLSPALAAFGQEAPQPSPTTKEHELLKQFLGEWNASSEFTPAPGLPAISCKGVSKVRALGGLWIVGQTEATMGDIKISSVLTLGYDPEKKKYVGTWVDSMFNHMWKYEGTVDESGKIFTLEAEGPDMTNPGKTAKYRDVYEFKSSDHKVLTSQTQGPDGAWVSFMTMDYKRAK